MSLRKNSNRAYHFLVFSTIQGKMWPLTSWSVSSKAVHTLLPLPISQDSTCPGLGSKCSKTEEAELSCLKTLSEQDSIETQQQSGGWGLKTPHLWPLFSSIHGPTTRPSTFVTFPQRLYNHYNYAHPPGQQMGQSPGPGPDSESKTVEVGCSC